MILSKMFYSYDKYFYFAPRMLYYRQVFYGIYATGFDSYSPVRGRKRFTVLPCFHLSMYLIHIAPLGDGNLIPCLYYLRSAHNLIHIAPLGDGNASSTLLIFRFLFDSYSPVRGRKLLEKSPINAFNLVNLIHIAPLGDGNITVNLPNLSPIFI